MTEPSNTWPLQAARNRLGRLVRLAATAPQIITVRGQAVAVVLSLQQYAQLHGAGRPCLSAELLWPGLLLEDESTLFDDLPDDDRRCEIKL